MRLSSAVLVVLLSSSTLLADDFPRSIVSWEPSPQGPVFAGEGKNGWDAKIRERGWIARDRNLYHLWYTGYNEALSPDRYLGHATSPDGLTWTRDPANPIHKTSWVEDVCLVKKDGVSYLFAEGKNDRAHMMTSADGIHWEDRGTLDVRNTEGRPITPGPFGTPTVVIENGIWHLFYERGDRGVWLATSPDAKIWTNVSDEPVLKMGPEPYDKEAVAVDQIIKRDGVFYAFYHANSHKPWGQWTTCVARSKDLVHWEKYEKNPIIPESKNSSAILIESKEGDRLYLMHPDLKIYRHPKLP